MAKVTKNGLTKNGMSITSREERGGKVLVIEIPLPKNPEVTESGKTFRLATSHGFMPVEQEVVIDGLARPIILSLNLNAYVHPKVRR